MNQVMDFFRKLFDTSDFPARWHCGNWTHFHGWFYIISDVMVWGAYFAIPVIILFYSYRQRYVRFHKIYILFAAFILACGLTHLIDAIIFWTPIYRLSALVRFATGVISWFTVYHLFKILPATFNLKTPFELEKEVEQRRMAEEALTIKNRLLNEAQEIARLGHWEWDVAQSTLEWSQGMYKVFGLSPDEPITYERFLERLHPDDREFVHTHIQQALATKSFPEFYHRVLLPNGEVRTIQGKGELVLDDHGNVVKMLGTGQDVTLLKKSELDLMTKTRELEEVNSELEKFAYVASHDLQEPLRKMITFTSLLEKEYGTRLDDRANTFIKKINRSSSRMQNLINDILNFSRISSEALALEKVDLNRVVKTVLSDLELMIQQSGGTVSVETLPEIHANPAQMQQLFQNLISNGIKFARPGVPPHIAITCTMLHAHQLPADYAALLRYRYAVITDEKQIAHDTFCSIAVADNGIGFDETYRSRIFEVFQRLHSKMEYEGTGIGLAICKKIAENHEGTISASSQPGAGSVFTIILPTSQRHLKLAGREYHGINMNG